MIWLKNSTEARASLGSSHKAPADVNGGTSGMGGRQSLTFAITTIQCSLPKGMYQSLLHELNNAAPCGFEC